jgi:hypothetical protein
MAGVISFSDKPEEIWMVAGWAFRQVLDDIVTHFPSDSQLRAELEQAEALSGLSVDSLPHDFADRVTSAIRHVVRGILEGTIQSGIVGKPYGTAETIEQYREALRELLNVMPSKH